MAEITPNPQDVVKKIEKLPMYTFFCQKVIPLAFDESLSYLETLYAFQYFLNNTVIPTVNNNAEAVTELQGLYEELNTYVTDYFDNLDVQQEINNKLASMSQSGELTNLIKGYVDPFIEEQNEDIEAFEDTVRAQINYFDSKVRALSSGSPKGVYPRIEDLRNANPETGVYIVSANGHIYGWTKDQSESPVDLGVYQSTGIADKSVQTRMIEDYAVIKEKIGDMKLITFEEYFDNQGIYSIDTEKLTQNMTANPNSTNAGFVAPNYANGIAIPFKYDNTKKYNYLYIPKIKFAVDGLLSISITTSEPTGQIQTLSNIHKTIKVPVKTGEHLNLVIPISNLQFAGLENESTNWIVMYQLTNESNPTYNTISPIQFSRKDGGSLGDLFDTTANPKYLINFGAWNWNTIGTGFYDQILPRFSICEENPYTLLLDEYIRNIQSYNILKGKKINFLGDSITQGVNGSGSPFVAENPYPKIIEEEYQCTCRNYGIAGSTLAGDGTTRSDITQAIMGYLPMNTRISGMNTDVDYNVVWGGINDCIADREVPVGQMGDTTNLTFYGAMDIMCRYMLNNFSTKKNCFITPPRNSREQNINPFGNKVKDYVDAVIEVANKYGIPVLDIYNNFGGTPVNATWKNANMTDGTHPNQNYYYVLAHKIAEFLQTL